MRVMYQSPEEVIVQSDGNAIPLYCVASAHCIEYKYEWQVGGQHTGCNSPILWINTPGLYRCRVRHRIRQEECVTELIRVSAVDSEKG